MPEPIAICIEDLGATRDSERYLRCVALPGRQPGLGIDATGAVLWRDSAPGGCETGGPQRIHSAGGDGRQGRTEIWVSGDQQLILYRPAAGAPVTVERGGRTLAVPVGKPVVLLGGDELAVGARRLRIHVHGPAPAIHPPEPLEPETRSGGVRKTVAAALALTAALGASDCRKPVEVRDQPPAVAPMPRPDAKPALKPDAAPKPIEVRDRPPEAPADPEPKK